MDKGLRTDGEREKERKRREQETLGRSQGELNILDHFTAAVAQEEGRERGLQGNGQKGKDTHTQHTHRKAHGEGKRRAD